MKLGPFVVTLARRPPLERHEVVEMEKCGHCGALLADVYEDVWVWQVVVKRLRRRSLSSNHPAHP